MIPVKFICFEDVQDFEICKCVQLYGAKTVNNVIFSTFLYFDQTSFKKRLINHAKIEYWLMERDRERELSFVK